MNVCQADSGGEGIPGRGHRTVRCGNVKPVWESGTFSTLEGEGPGVPPEALGVSGEELFGVAP